MKPRSVRTRRRSDFGALIAGLVGLRRGRRGAFNSSSRAFHRKPAPAEDARWTVPPPEPRGPESRTGDVHLSEAPDRMSLIGRSAGGANVRLPVRSCPAAW